MIKKVLPISLIGEGKKALVIGGGTIALRKTQRLIDSGIKVTVIAKKVDSTLASLVKCYTRAFKDTDINKKYDLIYAITNDPSINSHIIELARQKGILCTAADKSWSDADFISPSSFSTGDFQISINSGGRSCRATKKTSSWLMRLSTFSENSEFVVIGTDHACMPLEKREKISLAPDQYDTVAKELSQIAGVQQFFLLNTCNRCEVYAILHDDPSTYNLVKKVLQLHTLPPQEYYCYQGNKAFSHLSMCLAGLLSQAPGETHIVSQVKSTVEIAVERNYMTGVLREIVDQGLFVSKKVRERLEGKIKVMEIEEIAIEKMHRRLKNKKVLIIGSGMVGRDLATTLLQHDVADITIFYRNYKPELDGRINIIKLDDIESHLTQAHFIFCAASGNNTFLFSTKEGRHLSSGRKTTLVDLSVPRGIDPALANWKTVDLIDLESLKTWYLKTHPSMKNIRKIAYSEIERRMPRYEKILC